MGYEYAKLRSRLFSSVKKILQSISVVEYVVASTTLSKPGDLDCTVRYSRYNVTFRFRIPSEGFDIDDLVILCIESARTRSRLLESAFSFIIFLAIMTAWYIIPPNAPDYLKIVLPILVVMLGAIISIISRARTVISKRRLRTLKESYKVLTVTDGLSSEVYRAMTDVVTELLATCGRSRKAAMKSEEVLKIIRERYPQVLSMLNIVTASKSRKQLR